MNVSLALLLASPPIALTAAALVPPNFAANHVRPFRRLVVLIAAIQCLIHCVLAVAYAAGMIPTIDKTLLALPAGSPLTFSVYYDGVTSLMLALVSFVGWTICRYSTRYLDGERSQGQYFRWTGFTIGAVSLMVISGNLLMFVGCWVMTSLGLHKLLLHYGHRPAARRAAWTKFTISRFGDAALLAAIAIIYREFETFQIGELFSAIKASPAVATPAMGWAATLLIVGAVTKSAQFPLHTWLPLTMETPTPVSALMHAGVVNAGGYLIIRMSPLAVLSPGAMSLLAIIGAITACFAAAVMLTQTSVKKSLAYSTIAQMGFMMLQCGLGAFSAAMLHILAHSLYKAHAFLSSGSVLSRKASTSGSMQDATDASWTDLAIIGTGMIALLAFAFAIFGIDFTAKPGGVLLGGILCLALTHWLGNVLRTGSRGLLVRATLTAAGLCLAYVAGFTAVDVIVRSSLPTGIVTSQQWLVALIISGGFLGLFVLHTHLSRESTPRRMHAWYVHASNGFYVESMMRRIVARLSATPRQQAKVVS